MGWTNGKFEAGVIKKRGSGGCCDGGRVNWKLVGWRKGPVETGVNEKGGSGGWCDEERGKRKMV